MTGPVDSLPVRDLVRQLGGPTKVARQLGGLSCEAVCMWFRSGRIPQKHHLPLWRLAQAKGIAWCPPGFEGLALAPAEAEPPVASNDTHQSAA
jgi:hypothetical protein